MSVTIRSPGKEISLPPHITCLSEDLVDDIFSVYDAADRIVACGIDPRDSSLCLLTGDLNVRQISPNGTMIPTDAFPEFDGRHIVMSFKDYPGIFRIRSEVAIGMSESCLDGAEVALGGMKLASIDIKDTYVNDESDAASAESDNT